MARSLVRTSVVAIIACAVGLSPGPVAADVPFTQAVFAATHNSYSGGERGSITSQLDHGVRFIEFDVHDNDYATNHDYGIGHNSPGDEVDHNGNPASNLLHDWLATVATWSAAHPAAAPIVVMLDLKDDLTDNPSYAAGNLTALNHELEAAFGTRLLRPADYAGQSVDALRGKVLTLLSGNGSTRTEYRRDVGYNPAVALNGHGQVVEVHDSGGGALWYWTGTYQANGTISWQRHGKYDSGVTPAVALNDDGWLVEVHKSQSSSTIWYHVGHLAADGEISWSPSHQYDNGVLPTVAFTGSGLREIHQSQSNSQNWQWLGTLNTAAGTVSWTGNAKTSDPRFDKSTSVRGSARVTVSTSADGPMPAQTLHWTTDRASGRIRYQQTAFDEFQAGDNAQLQEDALFYGSTASNKSFIVAARNSGHLVRGWDFDSADLATQPLANYPATNSPSADWYQTMLSEAGAVQ
ncbi:hypothetical protein [Fodinicola acaciae]|uniref:hypothetical protein n=1 Tax=Fodinicola acaciae TaxID=2681555 RepID=UPI0013D7C94D|nr:hypothetical protein [Fodinicola acaciae]